MELLKEIFDKPMGTEEIKTREAVRAVIFDEDGLIPMLYVAHFKYHKIPGGWIDSGENMQVALAREILEETGCTATILEEVGKIVEYVSEWNWMQTSYCYLGKIVEKWKSNFTENELKGGFEIQRMSIDDAIAAVKNDKPDNLKGRTVQARDIIFLEKAKEILNLKK